MIRHIFRKDLTLLWPLAVLVIAIQVTYEWAIYKSGIAGANPVAAELVRLLLLPWFIGIVVLTIAAVQEDTIPGADQDWLIRPIRRADLLLAKIVFVLAVIFLPMLVVNFAQELALGFPALPALADALYKELFLFVCLIVPVMAVASATRNMTDLLILLAGLVVLYAISLWLSAVLSGANRCPTCDTGVSWLQHQLQHVGVLVGSGAILVLQYRRRRTAASRWIMAVGVAALVFVQIPWNAAFFLQSWWTGTRASSPAAIGISAGTAVATTSNGPRTSRPDIARRATQALMHGNVDAAVENLKRFTRPEDSPVGLVIPLQLAGLSPDEFVMADRWEVSVADERGTVLYRNTEISRNPEPLKQQALQIPGAVYRQLGSRPARLTINYSLTLMGAVSEYKMRAVDGEIRASGVGLCQSNSNSTGVHVRCRQIGQARSCFTATLYGPGGEHNQEVVECSFDYRPYIPSPVNIINVAGIDLPTLDSSGLAHYAVDAADLPQSYLILKSYAPRLHFKRTVVSALPAGE